MTHPFPTFSPLRPRFWVVLRHQSTSMVNELLSISNCVGNTLKVLEARGGIEPPNKGFALLALRLPKLAPLAILRAVHRAMLSAIDPAIG